jgi:hypothetical protein
MKYLSYYKKLYRKAKTEEGRQLAIKNAVTDLYPDDLIKFNNWYINYKPKQNEQ